MGITIIQNELTCNKSLCYIYYEVHCFLNKSFGFTFSLPKFASIVVTAVVIVLALYSQHCIWVTSSAYSSPSIVMAAQRSDGGTVLFDDYREAYYWLRQNTPPVSAALSCCFFNLPSVLQHHSDRVCLDRMRRLCLGGTMGIK